MPVAVDGQRDGRHGRELRVQAYRKRRRRRCADERSVSSVGRRQWWWRVLGRGDRRERLQGDVGVNQRAEACVSEKNVEIVLM